jgi:hypothetical protein
MIGIELKVKEISGVVRKRGTPIDSFSRVHIIAVLTEDGYIKEVLSGDGAIILRDLYQRYAVPISLEQAEELCQIL